jgi:hypothetical protein
MNKLASKLINILIFTTIFLGLTAGSCDSPKYEKPISNSKIEKSYNTGKKVVFKDTIGFESLEFKVLTIDSCEYIVSGFGKSANVAHKGNCKFCQSRNKNKEKVESCSIR